MLLGCDDQLDPDTMLNFSPDKVLVDNDDVLYLFREPTDEIYRWSAECGAAYPVIDLGAGADYVDYASVTHALFVGYASGEIRMIDLATDLTPMPFATLTGTAFGIAVAGNYLVAVDSEGAWETHYTFDLEGTPVHAVEWNHPSPEYEWSETNSRLYFFREGTSPNDLHWEEIDQSTGLIVDDGESPYHGDYAIVPPIRVSDNGEYVVLGSGHVYDGGTLERPDAVPVTPADAAWLAGTLVTLRGSNPAWIERWDPAGYFERIDVATFPGLAQGLAETQSGLVVVTFTPEGLAFHPYSVGVEGDGDGDGTPYEDDAFPGDPAASIDTDHDGAPDSWNPGASEEDSITGLSLDAHPGLAACSAPGPCPLDGQPLALQPADGFVGTDGVVYLHYPFNRRIVRWDLETDSFLDSIPLSPGSVLTAYDPFSQTVYVAHDSGWIGEVDLAGDLVERHFRTLPEEPHGLAMVGNFLLVADSTGAWHTHYIFDWSGAETARVDWNYLSPVYAWNPLMSRVYFFDGTEDIHYEEIDQVSGAIVDQGESPYLLEYDIIPPLSVSETGLSLMIGTGQLYDASDLTHVDFLPQGDLVDILWRSDEIVTIRGGAPGETIAERWSPALVLQESTTIEGAPYRVFPDGAEEVVVTLTEPQPAFSTF